MDSPEVPQAKQAGRFVLPRWAAFIAGFVLWTVLLPLVHGVLPWALSMLGQRHGWKDGRPGAWNWFGLILIAAAAILFIWTSVLHYLRVPERMELEVTLPWKMTPPYLLTHGPYGFTRHPMYVGVLALWLGWTFLYGSVAVLVGCLVLCTAVNVFARWEERALEGRFGDVYLQYKRNVPRWIG